VSLELLSSIYDWPINKSYLHGVRRGLLYFCGYNYDDYDAGVFYDDGFFCVFSPFLLQLYIRENKLQHFSR
jgi:hypothetical protein